MSEELRTCRTCGKPKPLSRFPPQSRNKELRRFECRTCRSRQVSPAGKKRKALSARKRMWLKRGIDITPEEYERRYEEQGGRCKCCGDPQEQMTVDHDHTTGEIRGLLCTNCNIGLGHFKDDIERLRKGIMYLESQEKKAAA